MSDLSTSPWNVILAYTHLESVSADDSPPPPPPPTDPHHGLALARFLSHLFQRDHELLHVPPPDRLHLLTVAWYPAAEKLAAVFSDVHGQLDDHFVPHKILSRFARYAAGIPTSLGLALTCVARDGRELPEMPPAMADVVHRPGHSNTEKKLMPVGGRRPGHFNVRKKLVLQAIHPSKRELTAMNSDSDGAPKPHSISDQLNHVGNQSTTKDLNCLLDNRNNLEMDLCKIMGEEFAERDLKLVSKQLSAAPRDQQSFRELAGWLSEEDEFILTSYVFRRALAPITAGPSYQTKWR